MVDETNAFRMVREDVKPIVEAMSKDSRFRPPRGYRISSNIYSSSNKRLSIDIRYPIDKVSLFYDRRRVMENVEGIGGIVSVIESNDLVESLEVSGWGWKSRNEEFMKLLSDKLEEKGYNVEFKKE